MAKSSLVSDLAKLGKQKIIPATVTDVLGALCSVRLSVRGTRLHGIKYFGATPAIGEIVYVNYQSGTPIAYTISGNIDAAIANAATTITATPKRPLEPPAALLSHNTLDGLQGGAEGDDDPCNFVEDEYYHHTSDEYINHIPHYTRDINSLQLGEFQAPWGAEPDTITNSADGHSLGRTGFVWADYDYRSDYDSTIRGGGTEESPTATKAGMIFKRLQGRGYYADNQYAITPRRVEMRLVASRDWDGTSNPTQIEFYITPPGSTNQYLAVMINDQGLINTYTNVIVNGGFDADTDWLIDDSEWTIVDGVAVGTGVYYERLQAEVAPLTIGKTYIVTFQLTVGTPSEDTIYWSDGVQTGTVRSANGIYSETFVAQGTDFYFESPGDFNGTIDDVTAVHIVNTTGGVPIPGISGNLIKNGTFDADTDWGGIGSGWTIHDGLLEGIATGQNGVYSMPDPFVAGRHYRVGFTIQVNTGYTEVDLMCGGQIICSGTSGGNHEAEFIAAGTDLTIQALSDFTGFLDNIYAYEVTGDVFGPNSATEDNLVSFDTTSKVIKDSGISATSVAAHVNGPKIDQIGDTDSTYGIIAGTMDGENVEFTVSDQKYTSGTLLVYLNGQLLTQGSDADWHETTPVSGTFQFEVAPESTDKITAIYY